VIFLKKYRTGHSSSWPEMGFLQGIGEHAGPLRPLGSTYINGLWTIVARKIGRKLQNRPTRAITQFWGPKPLN